MCWCAPRARRAWPRRKVTGAALSLMSIPAPLSALGPAVADVEATVISNVAVNAEYLQLTLNAPEPAPSALPGQFFHLECTSDRPSDLLLRRPMSIYKADPVSRTVEFLYKVTGVGTRAMAALERGHRIRILGPLGVGFKVQPNWRRIAVLGRGVGLATLAPLAELAAMKGIGVSAILSARAPALVMSVDRFTAAGAKISIVLDSDGTSSLDNVARILRSFVFDGVDAFFTCGSSRLMLLMQRLGKEFNIAGQVALEQQMACGLGMCFCCVRSFKTGNSTESRRVCIQGPVFNLEEVLPWS